MEFTTLIKIAFASNPTLGKGKMQHRSTKKNVTQKAAKQDFNPL
jgi:hypothetical protein